MKVVIAGGTGFIGSVLTSRLVEEGHSVVILTRQPSRTDNGVQYVHWLADGAAPEEEIQSADAFINLAGVSLNDGRWTQTRKQQIYRSRIAATNELLRIMKELSEPPAVFVSASAIGIYPTSLTASYTEASTERATDFLGRTVSAWEQTAHQAKAMGTRTVCTRFGVVLGNEGGALPLMTLPYKMFVGGKIGSGNQWLSWIHIQDAVNAILFCLIHPEIEGPVNLAAPGPMRMSAFGKTVASVLERPHWMPVPGFMMQLALGERNILVLEGQFVAPKKLLDSGFQFRYPSLLPALKDLLNA